MRGVVGWILSGGLLRTWSFHEMVFLTTLGALACSAGMILAWEAHSRPQEERSGQEFQTLVRGVGFGPAVDLSGCAFAFDPRLASGCPRDLGPLPSGSVYCTHHSFFSYPSPEKVVQDAPTP